MKSKRNYLSNQIRLHSDARDRKAKQTGVYFPQRVWSPELSSPCVAEGSRERRRLVLSFCSAIPVTSSSCLQRGCCTAGHRAHILGRKKQEDGAAPVPGGDKHPMHPQQSSIYISRAIIMSRVHSGHKELTALNKISALEVKKKKKKRKKRKR